MMKKLLLTFLTLVSTAFCEPVKIKNSEAAELLTALGQIAPGMSAQNTTRAARNMNALRPVVDAWAKGDEAARARLKIIPGQTKSDSPEGVAYAAEQKKNAADETTVELTRFSVSDEEINAAKIGPAVLSVLLLYIEPNPVTKK